LGNSDFAAINNFTYVTPKLVEKLLQVVFSILKHYSNLFYTKGDEEDPSYTSFRSKQTQLTGCCSDMNRLAGNTQFLMCATDVEVWAGGRQV
jgi:hypothetical protein